jgi:hypothetical protein
MWGQYVDVVSWDAYYKAISPEKRQLVPRIIESFPLAKILGQDRNRLQFTDDYTPDEWMPDTYAGYWYELTILAWGDFNGDGLEDVLIAYQLSATTGTLRMENVDPFTRLSPNGPLVQLDIGGRY